MHKKHCFCHVLSQWMMNTTAKLYQNSPSTPTELSRGQSKSLGSSRILGTSKTAFSFDISLCNSFPARAKPMCINRNSAHTFMHCFLACNWIKLNVLEVVVRLDTRHLGLTFHDLSNNPALKDSLIRHCQSCCTRRSWTDAKTISVNSSNGLQRALHFASIPCPVWTRPCSCHP